MYLCFCLKSQASELYLFYSILSFVDAINCRKYETSIAQSRCIIQYLSSFYDRERIKFVHGLGKINYLGFSNIQ